MTCLPTRGVLELDLVLARTVTPSPGVVAPAAAPSAPARGSGASSPSRWSSTGRQGPPSRLGHVSSIQDSAQPPGGGRAHSVFASQPFAPGTLASGGSFMVPSRVGPVSQSVVLGPGVAASLAQQQHTRAALQALGSGGSGRATAASHRQVVEAVKRQVASCAAWEALYRSLLAGLSLEPEDDRLGSWREAATSWGVSAAPQPHSRFARRAHVSITEGSFKEGVAEL